jgi:hypothetical protein
MREIDNSMSHYDVMKKVCPRDEYQAYSKLTDKKNGPFASVWANDNFSWNGVQMQDWIKIMQLSSNPVCANGIRIQEAALVEW